MSQMVFKQPQRLPQRKTKTKRKRKTVTQVWKLQKDNIVPSSSKYEQTQKGFLRFLSKASTVVRSVTRAVYRAGQLESRNISKVLTWILHESTSKPNMSKKTTASDKDDTSTEVKSLIPWLIKGVDLLDSFLDRAENEPNNPTQLYRNATDLICSMLYTILKNDHFHRIVLGLDAALELYEAELVKTTTHSIHLREFLVGEYKLLRAYGMPISKDLMNEISRLLIYMGAKKVTFPNAIEAIQNLYIEMRRLHKQLRTRPTKAEELLSVRRALIRTIIIIGGIIIVLVNFHAEGEGILLPHQAFLSESVGSGISSGAAATEVMALVNKVVN